MRAMRGVLGIAGIRRLLAAWFGGVSAEYGALVAVSVYAYAAGGTRAVALFGVLRILPALVLTPVVTSVADGSRESACCRGRCAPDRRARPDLRRHSRRCAAAGGPAAGRPGERVPRCPPAAQNALVPWLARTPEELTAANVLSSLLEGTAVFVGPLLVGIALAVSGPAAGTAAAAALMLASAVALARFELPGRPGQVGPHPVRQVADDLVGGLRIYPATPGTSTLLGLASRRLWYAAR